VIDPKAVFGEVPSESELVEYGEVVAEALGFPAPTDVPWLDRYDPADVRVIRRHGRGFAGLVYVPVAQYMGGRPVSMIGIHAVGVRPEVRGAGIATEMMKAAVVEMAATDSALTVLYPATQPLYRKAGYEQAGLQTYYEVPMGWFDLRHRDPDVTLERVGMEEVEDLAAVYDRRARRSNGWLARNRWCWKRLIEPVKGQATVLRARRDGQTTGYIILRKLPGAQGFRSRLLVTDLVAEDEATARRLLTVISDHRSIMQSAQITGGPASAELMLLAEQRFEVAVQHRWMARPLSVERALIERGYPAHVQCTVDLCIDDDLVPANSGTYRLTVSDGRGAVERLDSAEDSAVQVSVPGFGPLFTGFASAHRLAAIGAVAASSAALDAADAVFAGALPWMPEFF
jgi:predicted acetyltransferase